MSKQFDVGFRLIPWHDMAMVHWQLRLDVKARNGLNPIEPPVEVDYRFESRHDAILPMPAGVAGLTGNFNRDDLADALERLAKQIRGQTN